MNPRQRDEAHEGKNPQSRRKPGPIPRPLPSWPVDPGFRRDCESGSAPSPTRPLRILRVLRVKALSFSCVAADLLPRAGAGDLAEHRARHEPRAAGIVVIE